MKSVKPGLVTMTWWPAGGETHAGATVRGEVAQRGGGVLGPVEHPVARLDQPRAQGGPATADVSLRAARPCGPPRDSRLQRG
ncbi:MAG: hypothetical protein ACRDTJ_01615 [Pseudonocardiaceae bacterium]